MLSRWPGMCDVRPVRILRLLLLLIELRKRSGSLPLCCRRHGRLRFASHRRVCVMAERAERAGRGTVVGLRLSLMRAETSVATDQYTIDTGVRPIDVSLSVPDCDERTIAHRLAKSGKRVGEKVNEDDGWDGGVRAGEERCWPSFGPTGVKSWQTVLGVSIRRNRGRQGSGVRRQSCNARSAHTLCPVCRVCVSLLPRCMRRRCCRSGAPVSFAPPRIACASPRPLSWPLALLARPPTIIRLSGRSTGWTRTRLLFYHCRFF